VTQSSKVVPVLNIISSNSMELEESTVVKFASLQPLHPVSWTSTPEFIQKKHHTRAQFVEN